MPKAQRPQVELFDTHAHLDRIECCYRNETWFQTCSHDQFPSVVNDQDDFSELHDFQMGGIVWPGIMPDSSRLSVEFAGKNELCYAAVGIHPNTTGQANQNDWSEIVELSKNPCVSAIGETGLDRYWDTVPFEIQLQYFERHLDLAKDRGLPILIHSRDCDVDILHRYYARLLSAVHFFTIPPSHYCRFVLLIYFVRACNFPT